MKNVFIASTPAGSLIKETEADTFGDCVTKLEFATMHMPYKNWQQLSNRGYTIDKYEADDD